MSYDVRNWVEFNRRPARRVRTPSSSRDPLADAVAFAFEDITRALRQSYPDLYVKVDGLLSGPRPVQHGQPFNYTGKVGTCEWCGDLFPARDSRARPFCCRDCRRAFDAAKAR